MNSKTTYKYWEPGGVADHHVLDHGGQYYPFGVLPNHTPNINDHEQREKWLHFMSADGKSRLREMVNNRQELRQQVPGSHWSLNVAFVEELARKPPEEVITNLREDVVAACQDAIQTVWEPLAFARLGAGGVNTAKGQVHGFIGVHFSTAWGRPFFHPHVLYDHTLFVPEVDGFRTRKDWVDDWNTLVQSPQWEMAYNASLSQRLTARWDREIELVDGVAQAKGVTREMADALDIGRTTQVIYDNLAEMGIEPTYKAREMAAKALRPDPPVKWQLAERCPTWVSEYHQAVEKLAAEQSKELTPEAVQAAEVKRERRAEVRKLIEGAADERKPSPEQTAQPEPQPEQKQDTATRPEPTQDTTGPNQPKPETKQGRSEERQQQTAEHEAQRHTNEGQSQEGGRSGRTQNEQRQQTSGAKVKPEQRDQTVADRARALAFEVVAPFVYAAIVAKSIFVRQKELLLVKEVDTFLAQARKRPRKEAHKAAFRAMVKCDWTKDDVLAVGRARFKKARQPKVKVRRGDTIFVPKHLLESLTHEQELKLRKLARRCRAKLSLAGELQDLRVGHARAERQQQWQNPDLDQQSHQRRRR